MGRRAAFAATAEPLPWAPALGPRPSDPAEEPAWLTAATAVTAFRERYEIPEHTQMLGRRPSASRPDARAAWDYACQQADNYLARRLRHLDDQQLADLDARQQTILDSPPPFDPSELQRARENQLHAPRAQQLLVLRLEAAARAHREWRRMATEAQAIRRQITLEKGRRRKPRTEQPLVASLGRSRG